ncbi:MAG: sugar phosphate isomerase/epimerase [Clostridiales bacterium]|nr:sugar phosphate isomerase/epimerase [Clostridiales bacterium]
MIKLGCGTVLFRTFDLERSLDAIRNIGFEYFETQAVGPWCPHVNVEKDDPETLVRLKNKFGFKGITGLWSLNGNILSNPNSVASGVRSIEWAAAAGIPVVHTGDGHKPEGLSDEDAYKVLDERMQILLEAARKNNVTLAIEPHGTFSLTIDGLKKIMKLGDESCLGINYDGCNVFRAGYVESGNGQSGWQGNAQGSSETEVLKGIIDRVVHCHAKDVDAQGNCVAVGEGLVDVKGCVELLKASNYDGVVSVETEGGGEFEQVVELATKSYRYLNEIINK